MACYPIPNLKNGRHSSSFGRLLKRWVIAALCVALLSSLFFGCPWPLSPVRLFIMTVILPLPECYFFLCSVCIVSVEETITGRRQRTGRPVSGSGVSKNDNFRFAACLQSGSFLCEAL